MSVIGSFTKQPVEIVDFDIDFSDWLTPNDGVATVEVEVTPAGLLTPTKNISSPLVKIWTEGGIDGVSYKITLTATTDDGRVKQVEFKVKVKDS